MLQPKTTITLTNGQTARVLQLLGQGGQGAVYDHEKLYANPQLRLIEAEWVRLLQSVKDHIVLCPHCRQETFVDDQNTTRCVNCGTLLQVKARLNVDSRILPLMAGNRYPLADEICFEAVLSSTDNLLWLRNTGKQTWQVTTTKGEQRALAPKALIWSRYMHWGSGYETPDTFKQWWRKYYLKEE